MAAPHDEPDLGQLVEAVREWLERDVVPGTQGRMSFHARVAVNVLAMVERELAVGDEHARRHRARLDALGMTDEAELAACADAILAEHRRVDVLINNAARSIRRPIEQALVIVQINYLGAVGLTLKLLPRMLEQGHGQVVNISTLSTQVPIPLFSAYLASKSALESFSRSLQAELGHKGIDVTVVHFPMVRTPMSNKTSIYKHMRMMDTDAAADWLVKAVRERPARIARPLGNVSSVILAALPGPATRYTQPLFRLMDYRLKRKLEKD